MANNEQRQTWPDPLETGADVGLTANDFNGPVIISFEDGSTMSFTSGFVRRRNDKWYIYTEHCGYFIVPADGRVEYVAGDIR